MISGIGQGGGTPSASQMAQMRARMFERSDTDRSGGLDFKEFSAMAKQGPMGDGGPMGSAGSDKVQSAFKKLDANQDGSLDRAEIEEGQRAMMAQFGSTMDLYGGASSPSSGSDASWQTLLDALEHGGPGSGEAASSGSDLTDQLQQLMQQMGARVAESYGKVSASPPNFSLQA